MSIFPNSPCINVCKLDNEREYCGGCFRTLKEITDWRYLSEDKKIEVLKLCEWRKQNE